MATINVNNVKVNIQEFYRETKDAVETPEKAQKWLRSFRNSLLIQDPEDEDVNQYALGLVESARQYISQIIRERYRRYED